MPDPNNPLETALRKIHDRFNFGKEDMTEVRKILIELKEKDAYNAPLHPPTMAGLTEG